MGKRYLGRFSASVFVGDNNAQLVAGDAAAAPYSVQDRPCWAFDDTDEEAIVSEETTVPADYAGGTVKGDVHHAMASDATNDVALDLFVECKTPDSDTLDMEAAASWDSANSGTESLGGTTAGDPRVMTITLSNKDSMAAGDLFRIGLRRDCDSANDDASGDLYVFHVDVYEET